MGLWWYLEWTKSIHKYTLIYVRNDVDGSLISINVMEYTTLLITYAGAIYYYCCHPDVTDPYPLVLFYINNTASEA